MSISKSPELEICSKKTEGDIMIVDLRTAQENIAEYLEQWERYDTPLKEVLRELYSQGWYFQIDEGVWTQQRIDLLLQNIKINNRFQDSVMTELEVVDEYLGFRLVDIAGGWNQMDPAYIYLKHGIDESNDWPNNIIKEAIGLTIRYDAINKRKI